MKGVAIPYIIAVLLGVVVIGIIGYWIFVLGGKFGGELSAQECQGRLPVYCTLFSLSNYQGQPPGGGWDKYATGCSSKGVVEPDQTKCNEILGRGKLPIGASCTADNACASGNCSSSKCAARSASR